MVQGRRYETGYDQEILRLFIHGLFHLIGYDHEDSRERDIMEAKEHIYFHSK
ncbi:hypothetical protein CHISP_0742 [Chitinispirillum alkaliphilum]|nr:hypothetical protein CHISP_0742 [Chitinispirillum alkaliphilum]